MKTVTTGGTGFVGKHLDHALRLQGHDVVNLRRSDLALGAESLAELMSGADTVINLAGAPSWIRPSKRS